MKRFRVSLVAGQAALALWSPPAHGQGSIEPAAPPGAAIKTLQQIEPRTPIASLPFTIANSGSYYLTTNLTAGTPEAGITVAADYVTLDLNGFALVGAGPSTANVHAIDVVGARVGLAVENGVLANWSGSGLWASAAHSGRARRLRVTGVGAAGLFVGEGWIVSDCTVVSNRLVGGFSAIMTGPNCALRHCAAYTNQGTGIFVWQGCVVIGCAAVGNRIGISARDDCRISDCATLGNAQAGIDAGSGSTVDRCTSAGNGSDGIRVPFGGLVTACTVYNNATNGIAVTGDSLVRDCTAYGNRQVGIALREYSFAAGNQACSNNQAGLRATKGGSRLEGNQASANGGVGIECALNGNNNLVVGNNARANPGGNYQFSGGTYNARIETPAPAQDFLLDKPWANFGY